MPDAVSSRRDFEHMITGYDASIAYVDSHVAQVLDELDRQGVLDDAAIIISADHGDAFGEHGRYPFSPIELYDMTEDPYQTRDIAAESPEIVGACSALMESWLQQQMAKSAWVCDPLSEILRERTP